MGKNPDIEGGIIGGIHRLSHNIRRNEYTNYRRTLYISGENQVGQKFIGLKCSDFQYGVVHYV